MYKINFRAFQLNRKGLIENTIAVEFALANLDEKTIESSCSAIFNSGGFTKNHVDMYRGWINTYTKDVARGSAAKKHCFCDHHAELDIASLCLIGA